MERDLKAEACGMQKRKFCSDSYPSGTPSESLQGDYLRTVSLKDPEGHFTLIQGTQGTDQDNA